MKKKDSKKKWREVVVKNASNALMNEFAWSSEAASQKVAGTGIHLTCMSGQTSLRGTEGLPISTGKSRGNKFVLGELELSPVC